MLLIFGLYLNVQAITMMREAYGDCYLWQGGARANIIIQGHSCEEVDAEIRRQVDALNAEYDRQHAKKE